MTWTIGHFANVAKGLALAVGVVYAMWMVWLWWRRTLGLASTASEAAAKGHFAAYLEKALDYPELARPPAGGPKEVRERAQYPWFVGFLLIKAEEILLANPTPAWDEAIGRQLRLHREFLANPAFRDGPYKGSSDRLRGLIDAACAGEPSSPAAVVASSENARR